MKTIAALIAAAVLVPVAATAAPKPAASVESAAADAQAVVAKPQPRRYCVKTDANTGSRISRTECRPLQDWLAQGFDPRAK